MVYFLGILISAAAGFFLIRLLTDGRLGLILHILLALALGLGVDGTIAFYSHVLFNQFNHWIPVGIVAMLGMVLLRDPYLRVLAKNKAAKQSLKTTKIASVLKPDTHSSSSLKNAPRKDTKMGLPLGLLTLGVLAVPLAISAHHYPLGGWDAWSCWSLKAKFIFLGQENWKDALSPVLWRSNTHYPLLWPLINVWFWDLGGRFDQTVPMLNSIVIALLIAGILLFGLLELTGILWVSIPVALVVTALPFGVTLYISQYSDALLGLFLLSAFMCLLLAEKYDLPKLKILNMVFLGLMGFTKNEGLMAGVIAALLIFWHERPRKKGSPPPGKNIRRQAATSGNDIGKLIFWFVLASLPTIIFTFFIAPKNEAFINGLTSTDKPTGWARLSVILVYPWFELISAKWNGFWLLVSGGILLAGKKLWQSAFGVIGWTLVLYVGVVMAYYAVNTFFEINWWLSTTLSRILFALVPTITLWIGAAVPAPPAKGKEARLK